NNPELKVDIARDKAADMGIPIETVGRTLETMLGGRQVTRFKREGDQYDVIVKVADVDRTNPRDVSEIYVRGRNDAMIQLSNLLGLITKHGILIVEFANQLRERGRPIREAVVESAVLRLRPILMTTASMVLGAVPLAMATGAGAESRQQIGWVIVGGMLLGTLLTLFVVPTAYTLLARRHKTFEQRLEEDRAETQPQVAGAE